MFETAAACFGPYADPAPLAAEVPYALQALAPIRAAWPQMQGWVNLPLYNQSGAADDLMLAMYPGSPKPTPHAAQMPATTAVVERLRAEGFAVKQARIAVLDPRSALRCHVDMYPAARLILPLNAQGDAYRHVFDALCVAMNPGELWGVHGDVCHGAANLAATGHRVALLIDADLATSDPPAWYSDPWELPVTRGLARPDWQGAGYATEDDWHLAPFEYALRPEEAYAHLIDWCAARGDAERAAFWQSRACVCVPA